MSDNPGLTRFRFFCMLADAGKPMTINAMVKDFSPVVSYTDAKQIISNNLNHFIGRPIGKGQLSYELKHPHQYRGAWKTGQI